MSTQCERWQFTGSPYCEWLTRIYYGDRLLLSVNDDELEDLRGALDAYMQEQGPEMDSTGTRDSR